ncbi:hypothetical protein NHG32_07560 [Aerococcaceae bacterium NML191219]|nr:hypothetical protein [Aerococcaceae bacterium NML191219]
MKRLRLLVSAVALLLNPSAIHAETQFEQVSERVYIHSELKTKEIDLYAAPIYSIGEWDKEELLQRIAMYFDKELIFVPEKEHHSEGKTYIEAEHYELKDTGYWLNVSHDKSFTEIPKWNIYMEEESENPYTNLVNNVILFPHIGYDATHLANQELPFMSFVAVERKVQDFLQQVFAESHMTFQLDMRSITLNEMADYIDYQNVNKLKGEDYIGDFKEAYFGQITAQIGDYPVYWHTQGSETFFDGGTQGEFVLTEDGFKVFNWWNVTPVDTPVMTYPKEEGIIKVDKVEQVLSMVTKELERNEVTWLPEHTFYIEAIDLVYVPMKISGFSREKLYYPVWQVVVREDGKDDTHTNRLFIEPEGKIWR